MRYVLASAVSVLLWLRPVLSVEQLQVILSKSHANIVVASLCVPSGGSGCPNDTFDGHTQCCSQTRQPAGAASSLGLCTGRDAEQVVRTVTVGDGAEEGGGRDGGRQNDDHGEVEEDQSVSVHRFAGREFNLSRRVQECGIFYIGYEGPTLNNIMMRFSQCKVCGDDGCGWFNLIEGAMCTH